MAERTNELPAIMRGVVKPSPLHEGWWLLPINGDGRCVELPPGYWHEPRRGEYVFTYGAGFRVNLGSDLGLVADFITANEGYGTWGVYAGKENR